MLFVYTILEKKQYKHTNFLKEAPKFILLFQVAFKRTLPYVIEGSVLRVSTEKDAQSVLGVDLSWPREFVPSNELCKLCSSPLSQTMSHPGQKGKSYLFL